MVRGKIFYFNGDARENIQQVPAVHSKFLGVKEAKMLNLTPSHNKLTPSTEFFLGKLRVV
jgi:hypothetical protein